MGALAGLGYNINCPEYQTANSKPMSRLHSEAYSNTPTPLRDKTYPHPQADNLQQELFGLEPASSRKDQFELAGSYLGYSQFPFYEDSLLSQSSQLPQKDAGQGYSRYDVDSVSLSDMIRTDCFSEMKQASSATNLAVFNKLAGRLPYDHLLFEAQKEEGLDPVSNRRLQNRLNARRARQKKKSEIEEMRQLLTELQVENYQLRSGIERASNLGGHGRQGGLCWRCKKSITQGQKLATQVSTEENQTEGWRIKQAESTDRAKNASKANNDCCRFLEVDLKNEQPENKQSSGSEQMELQFAQFDFGQGGAKTQAGKQAQKDKYLSRIWIAVGIVMLLLGLNLHGLGGADQKSIHISETEAKRWMSDFKDQHTATLTVKMKAAVTDTLAYGEKQSPGHDRPRTKPRSQWGEQRSIGDMMKGIVFETVTQYAASSDLKYEESEVKIEKDWLYAIQAEFDDLGRYL